MYLTPELSGFEILNESTLTPTMSGSDIVYAVGMAAAQPF